MTTQVGESCKETKKICLYNLSAEGVGKTIVANVFVIGESAKSKEKEGKLKAHKVMIWVF